MKRFFAIFAMMLAFCMSTVYANVTTLTPTDTVAFTDSNCMLSYDTYSDTVFTFKGYSADSTIQMSIAINISNLTDGVYPATYIKPTRTYVHNGSYAYYANATDSIRIMTWTDDNTSYYRLQCSIVMTDTTLYDIDMTYHVPYEDTYYIANTTEASKEAKNIMTYYMMSDNAMSDSTYTYLFIIPTSEADTDYHVIGDTVEVRVYNYVRGTFNINDYIYKSYSGDFRITPVTDSTCTITGEVICHGDIKFYFNCQKPTAVNDIMDVATYQVYTNGNNIIINNADDTYVSVYDMSGRIVTNRYVNSDTYNISIGIPGIYIVQINNYAVKVIVK